MPRTQSDLDRLRAELRLAEATADDLDVFARLFEALEVPLAVWNRAPDANEFDLIASNEPAAALLGEHELDDPDPPTFAHEGLYQRLRPLLTATSARGLGEFSTLDGTRIFSARGVALGDGMVGVGFFDVTERRTLERERLEMVERMQHGQKLESLGVLAGGIAHDFNNLLAGIMGNTSLALLELPASLPARELLERAEATAQIASELTRQMLAYSGRGRFVIEQIDLSHLVEEMTRLLEVSLTTRAVVRYEMAEDLPPVEADPSQIRQVVMNLVTNASEAVQGTSGVIMVRTGLVRADDRYLDGYWLANELKPGDFVSVEVSDTGRGMPAAVQTRLFDPFFTTKKIGRGLGMAAVLGIVRSHEGSIKVYSEVGQGTTIKVLFPVSPRGTIAPAPAPPEPPGRMQDALVLVIDDEDTVRTVACQVLERHGCRTVHAADGEAGVGLFRQRPDEIDLILLDLTMPVMDGEEAFRIIRSIRPDVPIIVTSGYNRQDTTTRFAGRATAGFLQKPWTAQGLIHVVSNALEGGEG
ncbi:MAG: response regulator [Proteobacteria bacterium]|nr:response regulator [Pseudomonadota bacterium]